MNGAQPLNKGEMLPDQVQMAPSEETRLFLAIICFKIEVTNSYGVYAVANSSDFTVTTPMHFLEVWLLSHVAGTTEMRWHTPT